MPDIYGAPRRSQWAESRLPGASPDRATGADRSLPSGGPKAGPVEPTTKNAAKSWSATNANARFFFPGANAGPQPVPHLHLRKAQWPLYRIPNQYYRGGERHERRS